jgi:hypothetical protein
MDTKTQKTPKDFFLKVLFPSFALLIGIALLADLWVTESIIPKAETSPAGRVYRLINHKYENNQIPVFGSSRARCSYNPKFMGINAYNYGVDGYPIVPTLALVRNYCEKNSSVPVIINLDYYFPNWVDVVPVLPFLNNKHLDSAATISEVNKLYYHIYGIRYFDNYVEYFKLPFKYNFLGKDSSFNGYEYDLSVPVPNFKKLEYSIEYRKKRPLKFEARTEHINLMYKLFKDFPNNTFFLIRAPYHKTYLPTISNQNEVDKFINDLRAYKNVKVIHNFNDASLNDSCFTDNNHINRLGAMKFSHWLKDTLNKFEEIKPYLVNDQN